MNGRIDDEETTTGVGAVLDQLAALKAQDRQYQCEDYLEKGRQARCLRRKRQLRASPLSNVSAFFLSLADDQQDEDEDEDLYDEDSIDQVCREKMCAWAYKVMDHFNTPREMVAFAFAFLDRFVDSTCNEYDGSMDRNAFKLAAMTCLYLAVKIFHHKQMGVATLALMGGGEFEERHIEEMEFILLTTLGWKLNPPTAQAFVRVMLRLVPANDDPIVYQHAVFLAELAVYDYRLVTAKRLNLALACVLNAYELSGSVEGPAVVLESYLDLSMEDSGDVGALRRRLWLLYGASTAPLQGDVANHNHNNHSVRAVTPDPAAEQSACATTPCGGEDSDNLSPTSVHSFHHEHQQG